MVRRGYYNTIGEAHISGPNFCLHGGMGDSHKPTFTSDFILKPMMVWQQRPRIQQLKIDATLKTMKNLFNNINENRRIF